MIKVYQGSCLDILPTLEESSIHTCVTSPPYFGLRDYGMADQVGQEDSPQAYITKMVEVFEQVRRVLRDDGTCWVNLGDSFAAYRSGDVPPPSLGGKDERKRIESGVAKSRMASSFVGSSIKHKDLIGIPWRFAFAMQDAGWYLRQDIIWAKPNGMPESIKDRCTRAHEYIFMFTKKPQYYYDYEAILEDALEGGKKNKRTVWTVNPSSYGAAHFATYPPDLILPCIQAGCPEGGWVLDPFLGSGTTALAAAISGRSCVGVELNPRYVDIARERLTASLGLFDEIQYL